MPPAKKPPRKERNRAATQKRILDAAEVEFAQKGFKGTRLREVAAQAEVHHALLHHYYGDKVGLFRAVVDNAFASASTQALALLTQPGGIRELLAAYVDIIIGLHVEHPNLMRLMHFASLDASSPVFEVIEDATTRLTDPVLEALRAAVDSAQREGIIRQDIDPKRLITLAIGAVVYVFSEERFFGAFYGDTVRSPANVAEHRRDALAFLTAAIFHR